MGRRSAWLVMVVACLLSPGWAERRVAVLALHDEAGVGDAAADHLTDVTRQAVVRWGLGERLLVMTRENVLALLPPDTDLADCVGDCELQTARNVGADYVVTGELRRFAGELRGTLRLHDVPSGRLLGSQTAKAQALRGLEPAVERAAAALGAPLRTDPPKATGYAPSRLPALPTVQPPPGPPPSPKAMSAADVEAVEHYARVVRVEAATASTSGEKAAAWAALAKAQPRFAAEARARADAWSHRAEQEARRLRVVMERERRVGRDWARLQRLLGLNDTDPADRLEWVLDFIDAFSGDPTLIVRVEEARRLAARLQVQVRRTGDTPLSRKVGLPVTLTLKGGERLKGTLRASQYGTAEIMVGGHVRRVSHRRIERVD